VLIDWFTIIAQIANFLLLVMLLRRFLYRPILEAMEARQREVQSRLDEAEQKRQQAEAERKSYEAQNQELREQYAHRQKEAEEAVAAWKKEALHAARQEVETSLQNWRESIEQNKDALAASLRQFAVQQAYQVAQRAGLDLADMELENLMAMTFIRRLEQDKIDIARLAQPSEDGQMGELLVRSAFELGEDTRQQIQSRLNDQLGQKIRLRYEVEPDLAAGIELVSQDGYRAAWNLKRYLEGLEDQLERQLQAHFETGPQRPEGMPA
jgi:F-type H+-transporting ATPase subunit b